jgi:hypothetical protein
MQMRFRLAPLVRGFLSTVVATALIALPSIPARAAPAYELPGVLVIAKSSNRNQVYYAAQVDETCAPTGEARVRPYWRMFERGPLATEPLLDSEQHVLGIERANVAGGTIQFALRAMPARAFTIHPGRASDGRCTSWVGTTIAGVPARVASVYVRQKFFGGVDYVLLTGWADGGAVVRERVSL